MKTLILFVLFALATGAVLVVVEFAAGLKAKRQLMLALVASLTYGLAVMLRAEPVMVAGWIGLVAVSSLGQAFGSRLVGNAPGLLSFFITASVLDIISVASGPTRALFEASEQGATTLLPYLTLVLPWKGQLVPALGISDLFGIAVLMASLRSQGYSRRAALLFSLAGILLALTVALVRGGTAGYPFLAAAAVTALVWGRRQGD